MRTLMFERGAIGGQAGGLSAMDLNINDIIELARRSVRNGRPALEDPLTRDELMKLVLEAKGNQLMGAKSRIPALCEDWPTAIDVRQIKRIRTQAQNDAIRFVTPGCQRSSLHWRPGG